MRHLLPGIDIGIDRRILRGTRLLTNFFQALTQNRVTVQRVVVHLHLELAKPRQPAICIAAGASSCWVGDTSTDDAAVELFRF